LDPFENLIYRLSGVNPRDSMDWKQYFLSLLLVNILQMALAFSIFIFQDRLPLNPQGFQGLTWDLAFMQVISFVTNTNLQHYNGEVTLSYLSQMMAVQFLQFASAASGICAAIAFVRGLKAGSKDLGNFYADFVRSLTRLLLPLCFAASLVLVWLGIPQTLSGDKLVATVEGASQLIFVGPVASLVSIMQIGTNGGGYYGANSAHPFMNPNPASNILEILLMMLVPTSMCFVYGEMLGNRKESRPIVWGSFGLLFIDLAIAFIPSPVLGAGMEVRFGGFLSTLWTVVTTATMTGSLNAWLSAMHPLTILSGFMGMLLQSSPGGKGMGMVYTVMYVVITVFIVGLMSGRTPEYLGMKINARDVTLVMVAFLIHPVIILIPTVLAYASGAVEAIGLGGDSIGFTQILYEFTTAAANNGSDFLGTSANTLFFNISTAIVMGVGRYAPMGLLLALSGSMIGRKRSTETGLQTNSVIFSMILIASSLVLVVLTFFPFLALGPILSYFRGLTNGL
jgi:K+-transporting ATPase ATPase A chain